MPTIPLKQKYLLYKPPGNGSRSNNSGKANKFKTLMPRRVNYGPFWWHKWNSQQLINHAEIRIIV